MELNQKSKESILYPGEYVPLKDLYDRHEMFPEKDIDVVTQPFVNITEFDHHYKVDVVVPGVRREDIVVKIHGRMLSFYVSHLGVLAEGKKTRLHEFDGCYFERHILLPKNSDPEFISAEYRDGIISLHIPKSDWAEPVFNRRVVVY